MADTFGFGTDTTGFSNTVRTRILREVVRTLRAGLIALPKGAVIPANLHAQSGETFTLRAKAYPDLNDSAVTNPLSEGVPPTALKLAIDTMDFTVAQMGAYTKVTDIAQFQSADNLEGVASEKIARLAAQTIDNIALTAIRAHAVDRATQAKLSTDALIRAVARMRGKDVLPAVGGLYYALCHPYALAEATLNGWTDAAKHANPSELTQGTAGDYRGVRFLTSTRILPVAGANVTLANPSAAADDIIDTSAAHGFVAGDRVRFTALTGGAGLAINTSYYVIAANLAAQTFQVWATPGGAAVNFTTDITAGTVVSYNDPVFFLGQGSMFFGDVRTITLEIAHGPTTENPLAQFATFGFKGILGGKVASFAEQTDGAAVTDPDVERVYTITVQSDVA